jgi:THO complex subunit 5
MSVDHIVKDPSLSTVLQISSHARDQAAVLVGLLTEATEADADESSSAKLEASLSKQQKLLFTNVSHLRGLHRAAYFAARDTKAQTAEARQEVDRLHLQLQNLYYEQRHLQGEIAACEAYEYVLLPELCW